MKHTSIKAIAACLALMLTTGCTGSPASSQPTAIQKPEVAMGRYVESSADLPADLAALIGLQADADGGAECYAFSTTTNSWQHYSSADGLTWVEAQTDLIEKSGFTDLNAVTSQPDGTTVLVGKTFTEEILAKMAELDDGSGFIDDDSLQIPQTQFLVVSPDGTQREIPFLLPPAEANNVNHLLMTENGDLVVGGYNDIYLVDGVTGALKNTYALGNYIDSIALGGNRLAAMVDGAAELYDLESGDKVETISQLGLPVPVEGVMVSNTSDNDRTTVAATGKDGSFYFCNSTGIYHLAANGTVPERLVDGALVSLGTPSLTLENLLILPDGLLVLLVDQTAREVVVRKYVFDETVPALPDKELRVFSLKENKTVRQAIGQYQVEHPDTRVTLELPAAGVTRSDALRTLSTQLLAGKGPDLLVLDGMPIDSYLDKKVLLELPPAVTDGLLPNIAETGLAPDGKRYVVPARFSLPLMAGEGTAAVNSPDSLAACIETLVQKNPDTRLVLQNCGGATLLNTLYPVFADTLYTDGKPDMEKLSAFLQSLKRIVDTQSSDPKDQFITDADPDAGLDVAWSTVQWCLGSDVMGLGQVESITALSTAAQGVTNNPGTTLHPLSTADDKRYLPSTLLGVTGGSVHPETALDFLQTVLAAGNQTHDFADGLPVNSAALDAWLTPRPEEAKHIMSYGVTGADDETRIFSVNFPEQTTLTQLRSWIDALDTPASCDRTVLELLRTETTQYFTDVLTLEETISALSQKLTLLEAE